MSNLENLKDKLQTLVDKGKITAKQYQDKIDEAIYSDGGYQGKGGVMERKHIALVLGGIVVGFLIGKSIK